MEHKWPILFGKITGVVEQVWSEGRDDTGREIVREVRNCQRGQAKRE